MSVPYLSQSKGEGFIYWFKTDKMLFSFSLFEEKSHYFSINSLKMTWIQDECSSG